MNNENLGYLLSKYFRPIMIVVGIIIALCICGIIAVIVHNLQPDKTLISVNVAPTQATITIDGQEYHNGTYEFAPGQYQANIAADGFESKTLDFNVESSKTTPISTYLVNKKEGMDYYENSAADLQVLGSLSEPEAQEFMQRYNKKLTIRDYLPIDATYNAGPMRGETKNDLQPQTITDGSTDSRCSKAFCLKVTGRNIDQQTISDTISNLGYNINDYEVIYDADS